MLVYCKDGQPHFLCYVLDRFSVDAPKDEGTAALRWQRVKNDLEMAQFVACVQGFFRRIVGMQNVQFRDQFERHDLFPPGLVDQQIARDLKEKSLAAVRAMDIAIGIGARHAFSNNVIHVMAARYDAAQT